MPVSGLGRVYDSVWTREGWREDPNAKAKGGLSKAKGPGSGRAFILDSHTIPYHLILDSVYSDEAYPCSMFAMMFAARTPEARSRRG